MQGYAYLREADYVFGCLDNDYSRLILNELCQAYERPYFDLASDIDPKDQSFGGRVVFADGEVCVICKEVLDPEALRWAAASETARLDDGRIYGVRRGALAQAGPAVVSVNGVIASLAVTEFMVTVTALRKPDVHLEYRGDRGIVVSDRTRPSYACYYCHRIRGKGIAANVERYIPKRG